MLAPVTLQTVQRIPSAAETAAPNEIVRPSPARLLVSASLAAVWSATFFLRKLYFPMGPVGVLVAGAWPDSLSKAAPCSSSAVCSQPSFVRI